MLSKFNYGITLSWTHWFVVISSFLLTVAAYYISSERIAYKNQMQFQRETEQVVDLMYERMERYEDALRSGVAIIHANDNKISFSQWEKFAKALRVENKYPGTHGIGVITHIRADQEADFVADQRAMKEQENFYIHPATANDEKWVVTYIQPVASNASTLGLDIAFEDHRLAAAQNARDTGKPMITAPINLVQDAAGEPGFLFYMPYYKASTDLQETVARRQETFLGLVYAPFVMNELMRGTLLQNRRLINISIHDGNRLLYDEISNGDDNVDASPMFEIDRTVDMYGRAWKFHIETSKEFAQSANSLQPYIILAAGIFIDIMLIMLFSVMSRANRRSAIMAASMSQNVKELKNAMEFALEGIALINSEGNYVYANDSYASMLGYQPHEMIDMPWSVSIADSSRRDADQAYAIMRKKGKAATELTGMDRCGHEFQKQVTMVAHETDDGEYNGHYCFAKNINARKQAEREREMLIDKLVESNAELERFAYTASHDLQEPLRMIVNFSDILKSEYQESLDKSARDYLNILHESGKRMQTIISDLLEYSRISNHGARSEMVSPEVEMQHVLENIQQLITESGAKVTFDALPDFYGNPTQFMRLLQNLIVNAIRYSRDGVPPMVHVSAVETLDAVEYHIQDNGIGIEPQFIDAIFQPFKRLHHWDHIKGSGLGLSVCRRIAERMAGTITVHSVVGEGSTFVFTIPKLKSDKNAA